MNNTNLYSEVVERFDDLDLCAKITILKDILKYPIYCKSNKFFKLDKEYSYVEMADEISIMLNWLTYNEILKLYNYFKDVSRK